MRGKVIYLDSSAIVKRYVKEPSSDIVRQLYRRAYAGDVLLSFSIWNVGEVLGVLDKARNYGRLDDQSYSEARRRFLLETRRLLRLDALLLVPLRTRILVESWRALEKYHIYQADALQIASARYVGSSQFFSGDKKLCKIASKEGFNSMYLG